MCGDFAAESGLVDVVDEGALASDLHHREPFPVGGLELGIAGDVDLLELEVLVAAHLGQLSSRALAEMAVGGVVEGDPDYG